MRGRACVASVMIGIGIIIAMIQSGLGLAPLQWICVIMIALFEMSVSKPALIPPFAIVGIRTKRDTIRIVVAPSAIIALPTSNH